MKQILCLFVSAALLSACKNVQAPKPLFAPPTQGAPDSSFPEEPTTPPAQRKALPDPIQEQLDPGQEQEVSPPFSNQWEWREILQFEVLNENTSPVRTGDPHPKDFSRLKTRRLCAQGSGRNECLAGGPYPTASVNGTFYDSRRAVMGASLRRGLVDRSLPNGVKYYSRGAVAQRQNGTFAFCLVPPHQGTLDEKAWDQFCGDASSGPVTELLQGGALLVHEGQAACSQGKGLAPCRRDIDLYEVQRFDNGAPGLGSDQMRSTQHLVIAGWKGRLFAAWPKSKMSGRTIQSDLLTAGFEEVLKFDGGSGFFVRGENLSVGKGDNPSGFLIASPE